MLYLSRREGDVIRIGDDIKVKVMHIREGGTVSIGIDAPREVSVHREEIYDKILTKQKAEKQQAEAIEKQNNKKGGFGIG